MDGIQILNSFVFEVVAAGLWDWRELPRMEVSMGICVRCSAEIPISRPSLPLVRTSASVWLRSWPLFFRFWLQIYLSLWDVLPAAAPALESNLNFTPKSCCCMYLGLLRLPAFFVAALRLPY